MISFSGATEAIPLLAASTVPPSPELISRPIAHAGSDFRAALTDVAAQTELAGMISSLDCCIRARINAN